jgi:periplasmic mercuric ion binding protein
MKSINIIVSFALILFLFTSCKEEANHNTEISKPDIESNKITAAAKPETATFQIDGMSCSVGCARTIEKKLASTAGVQEATVDFDKKEATVNFDASVVSPEKLQKIVEETADGKTYKVSDLKIKA